MKYLFPGQNLVSKPAGLGATQPQEAGGRPREGEARVYLLTPGRSHGRRYGAPPPLLHRLPDAAPATALLTVPFLLLLPPLHEVRMTPALRLFGLRITPCLPIIRLKNVPLPSDYSAQE